MPLSCSITSSSIWESERSRSASILIPLMLRSPIWKESSYRKLSGLSPAFFANTAVRCDWRVPSEGGLGRLTLAVEVGCFPWLDSADCSVVEVAAVAAGRSPAAPLTLTLAVDGVDVVRGPGCWRDSRRSSQAALLLLSLSCLLGFRGRLALFLLLVAGHADVVAVVTAGAGSLHSILKFCLSLFPSSTSLHQPPFSRHLMYIVRAWEAAGLRTELLLLDEATAAGRGGWWLTVWPLVSSLAPPRAKISPRCMVWQVGGRRGGMVEDGGGRRNHSLCVAGRGVG